MVQQIQQVADVETDEQTIQQQSDQEQLIQPTGGEKWYTKWWVLAILITAIVLVGFSIWYFFI